MCSSFLLLCCSNVIIINVSRDWVEFLNNGIVLGAMREIILRELHKVLFLNLEDVIVINVSGKWIELLNHGIVLWSVWEILLAKLNEVLLLDLEDVVVVDVSGQWVELLNHRDVCYTHLRAHETKADLVCRLLLEEKKPLQLM